VGTRRGRGDPGGSKDQLDIIFDLRVRHVLDLKERVIKRTRDLLRLEFDRVRAIRRLSLEQDAVYLDRLDRAALALSPYWDELPAATFGEVEALYLAAQQRGVA
jgi:hypothetical protein